MINRLFHYAVHRLTLTAFSLVISCLSIALLQSCGSDEEPKPPVLLTEKQLTSMTLKLEIPSASSVQGVVNESDKTITFKIGLYHDLSFVKVTNFVISPKSKILPDPSYYIDFRQPVTFSITAEDGSSVSYTVNIVRTSLEVTGTDKLTYEPGDVVTINGNNFWSPLQKATIVIGSNEQALAESGYSDAHATSIKYNLPSDLELGEYVIKLYNRATMDAPWGEPVSLPAITSDIVDKSTKITALGYQKAVLAGDPPLYAYYISCQGQFLGNISKDDIMVNAKLFLTKIGEPENKTQLSISSALTSSKQTFFYIFSGKIPSTVFPGKYYLSVEFNGKIVQSSEEVVYPFFQ